MPADLEADIQVGQSPAVVLSVRQSPTATRAQGCLIPWSQLRAAQCVERVLQQTRDEGLSAFQASILSFRAVAGPLSKIDDLYDLDNQCP